jgi:hypothetical protein
VFDEIKAVQTDGVSDEYIAKIKESRRRAHETALKENSFWLRELEIAYTFGDDPRLIPDITPMVDKVSSDRVRAAAKKIFSRNNMCSACSSPVSVREHHIGFFGEWRAGPGPLVACKRIGRIATVALAAFFRSIRGSRPRRDRARPVRRAIYEIAMTRC